MASSEYEEEEMRQTTYITIASFLLLFSLIYSFGDSFVESNIYYTAPNFDLKFANVTFGASKLNIDSNITGDAISLGETLSTICQAELINQKKTQFSINGIINLAFQEFPPRQSSGQDAILALLSTSLTGENQFDVSLPDTFNLTGLFGTANFGTAKINSLVTNFYDIPFVTASDLSRANPDNQFSSEFPAENKTFFQILGTYNYNTFSAVLQILNHFNWSLVGSVYQANNFGYTRKDEVMNYAANNSVPSFACGTIYYFERATEESENSLRSNRFKYYCQCIKEKDTIQVNVLWMSTTAAVGFITNLRESCNEAKYWTFIIADDFQSPSAISPYSVNLKNSLLIRKNGPWDYRAFLQECVASSTQQSLTIIKELIENFLSARYKCKTISELVYDANSKKCTKFDLNYEACLCDLDILENDPYISRLFFYVDLMTTYAQGISILQNNCTLLNEKAEGPRKVVNYCEKTTFTPEDLTFALRFVNFTGYTGQINFPDNIMKRSTKSYYLYSVYNESYNAVLVGVLNQTAAIINDTAIQFINNETPTSEIVPQNPDLSYAVVDVFFAISITELITCIILMILFITHRHYRCIKRMSPLFSHVILFGLAALSLSQLMLSFARTGALCIINVYLTRLGLITIFAGLIFKNYRIYKIFANRSAIALSLRESSSIFMIIIGAILYLGIITIFIAVFGYDAVLKTSSGNPYYQYITCRISSSTWNLILDLFMQIVVIILLIICLSLVWLTRKVHSDYRDTRILSSYIAILVATFLIFAPLEYTFSDDTDSELFRYIIVVESLTIIVVSGLALLFIPKVFLIYKERKMRKHLVYAR